MSADREVGRVDSKDAVDVRSSFANSHTVSEELFWKEGMEDGVSRFVGESMADPVQCKLTVIWANGSPFPTTIACFPEVEVLVTTGACKITVAEPAATLLEVSALLVP